MPRFRDLFAWPGNLRTGHHNAITDVQGVSVGHQTLIRGEGPWRTGQGPFRTGVTVIMPHDGNLYEEKVAAAVHTINGFGKVMGFEQVRELGSIESPIALTGTLNVPRVADALISVALEENPHIGVGFNGSGRRGYATVNVVVGETNDGFLSDVQGRPIGEKEVREALAAAHAGPVAEGAVGAGTGTVCFGWKGGVGTASRVLSQGYTVGALVQTNYGRPHELTILGLPVGRWLLPPPTEAESDGSIMIVLATDAPLDSRQLGRLCRRAAFGLARTGSTCHGGSGDFVIGFSTTRRVPDRPTTIESRATELHEQNMMSSFAQAVIEAVEEAVYNSLLTAETISGRDGHTAYALPAEDLRVLLEAHADSVTGP